MTHSGFARTVESKMRKFRRLPWACIRSVYRAQRMAALVPAIPYRERPELAKPVHRNLRSMPIPRMFRDDMKC